MEALKGRVAPALAWLACLVVLLAAATPLERVERGLADLLVWREQAPASDLVLVDIDEASLAAVGPWPWPRPLLAELADKIAQAGAERQAWDLLLAEPRPGDALLKPRLQALPVVLGVVPVIDPAVESPPKSGVVQTGAALPGSLCQNDTPFPHLRGYIGLTESLAPAQPGVGHLTPIIDPDGRLRKLPALICSPDGAIPTLMLAAALARHEPIGIERGQTPWSAPWYLTGGQKRIPLDASGNLQLDFRTPLAAYPTIPAYRLLGDAPLPVALKGKTVLLGASALGLGDRVATRLSPVTPGLAVHAELYSRLADGTLTTPLAHAWALPLLLAALASLIWVVRPHGVRFGLPLAAGVTVGFSVLLLNNGLQVAVLPALLWHALFGLALFALRFIEEKQARRLHQRRLASIIPPALLEQLDPDAPQDIIAARRRRFGVVHGQLRNLPQFANREEPEKVLAVFHALTRLAQQVASAHGAQLYPSEMHEFLLMWPNLEPQTDRPRMLQAARELHRGITRLLGSLEATTGLALEIAVHVDEALDGFIGSRDRRRPILYGQLRQVSQAMLALSAELASPILTSQAALPGAAEDYLLRELGSFKLEDIRQPCTLFACTQTLDPLPACDA